MRPPTLALRASREARREEAIEGRGEETVDMVVVVIDGRWWYRAGRVVGGCWRLHVSNFSSLPQINTRPLHYHTTTTLLRLHLPSGYSNDNTNNPRPTRRPNPAQQIPPGLAHLADQLPPHDQPAPAQRATDGDDADGALPDSVIRFPPDAEHAQHGVPAPSEHHRPRRQRAARPRARPRAGSRHRGHRLEHMEPGGSH